MTERLREILKQLEKTDADGLVTLTPDQAQVCARLITVMLEVDDDASTES